MTFLSEGIALLASSALSFVLIYYKVSITSLQQVVAGALIVLIIVLDRFILKAARPVNFVLRIFLLFLISLSLQALILSTGGFFSPFLILFHLFAIGLSFLVDIRTATVYLVISTFTLGATTFFDQKLKEVSSGDLGSIALYILSFIVIIPLSRFVAQRYHLKDALSKILTHQLKVQKDVFEGLSDMVIITNTSLKILSFNEATARGLRLSPSELIDRLLFEAILLKDEKDRIVNEDFLSINQILQDKTTRITKNLLLFVRNTSIPKKVNIQIRPAVSIDGKIEQIAFIISDAAGFTKEQGGHQNLQEALLKYEAVLENLRTELNSKGMTDLSRKADLFGKAENDILTAIEVQDHGLKPAIELKDAAQVLPKIISLETPFAKMLGVNLLFNIDQKYLIEAKKFVPSGSRFSPSIVTSPFFTVPIDSKWLDLLVLKLLDLTILLVSGTKAPRVQIVLNYDPQFVYISFIFNSSQVKLSDDKLLFTEYYGRLGMETNLRLGSGLEGYMAKTIAQLLGIPLSVKIDQSLVIFSLQLSKKPPVQAD